MSKILDRVGGHKFVSFVLSSHEGLTYECEDGYQFLVPLKDTEGATFLAKDKALLFMRWIRKQMQTEDLPRKSPIGSYGGTVDLAVNFVKYADGLLTYRCPDGTEFGVGINDGPLLSSLHKNHSVQSMSDYPRQIANGRYRARYEVGTRVRTNATLGDGHGYTDEVKAARRAGVEGVVMGHSDSHGICFEVAHGNETAWYEPEELEKC